MPAMHDSVPGAPLHPVGPTQIPPIPRREPQTGVTEASVLPVMSGGDDGNPQAPQERGYRT